MSMIAIIIVKKKQNKKPDLLTFQIIIFQLFYLLSLGLWRYLNEFILYFMVPLTLLG